MPAHEQFDVDLSRNAQTTELIEWINTAPPAYTEHPVVREGHADEITGLVHSAALNLEGVPYANYDSSIGIWIENMINVFGLRVADTLVCRCGCCG